MKKLLLCPKKSGNTYDVCKYVSENCDAELKITDCNSDINIQNYDIIIFSSGVYANHVHKNILRWIENVESDKINSNIKFYIFLTWFGRGESDKVAIKEVKNLLECKNLKLEDDYVKCFGKGMGVIRRSHPSEEEKEKVLSWVKKL